MKLRKVWDRFSKPLQKLFSTFEDERIDTDRFLGRIHSLNLDDPGAEIVRELVDAVGLSSNSEEQAPDGECPEDYDISPDVRETVKFFGIHQMNDVSISSFVLRLLLIGSGSTIRKLEKDGSLEEYRRRLKQVNDSR